MCESKPTTNDCRRCSEGLIGVQQLAPTLGIAEKTIRNQLSLGVFPIPSYRFGKRVLFKLSEVQRFISDLS